MCACVLVCRFCRFGKSVKHFPLRCLVAGEAELLLLTGGYSWTNSQRNPSPEQRCSRPASAGLGEGARWFSRDASTLAWLWDGGAKNTRWTGLSPENQEVSTFSPGPGSHPRGQHCDMGTESGAEVSLETPHTLGPSRHCLCPERQPPRPREGSAHTHGCAAQPHPSHPTAWAVGRPHQGIDPRGPPPRYLSSG